ncbi:MAG: phosphatase PAP2 family protein [Caldilineaceae bacterium]|nr:phosphatase PAP2 family protein [Caldilineaceae bacterium]
MKVVSTLSTVVVVTSMVLLSACTMVVDPNFQPQTSSPQTNNRQIEPGAGEWETWVLASTDEVLPAAPPDQTATLAEIAELKALAEQRDAAAEALVAYWNAGAPSYRWILMAIAEHAQAQIGPTPRLARGMALLNVAVYDATVAAWDAKYTYNRPRPSDVDSELTTLIDPPNSPSYPSEHAVVAGAASTILSYLFPDRADAFAAKAEEAAQSRLLAGVQYPSDVEAGMELGRAVAEQVIARAMTDGSDVQWDGTMPTGAGYWTGENPVQPGSGLWKTWVLTSGDQFRPPPPPAYDSEQMQIELEALKTFTPTFATTAAAYFWQSPSGAFPYTYGTTSRLLFENGLDANPPRAAHLYAAMSVAQYDAFVGCYDAKYTYWSMRPFQIDPELKSLFPAPNFPSYPSAHSCQTSAVVTVLGSFFPADAEAIMKVAEETGNSRMWAGIHFQSDVDAGFALGKSVGELVVERAEQMMQP